MPTIDKVQVEVEASAKGVSGVFSQLERQLSTLKSALNGLDTSKLQQVSKGSKALGIDTNGMTKAEKEVSSSIDKIKQALAGLKSYENAALGGDSSALTSLQRRVTSIQSDIDTLGEKLRQAGDTRTGARIDTDSLQAYREILADVQSSLNGTKGTIDTINAQKIKPDANEGKKEMDDLSDRAKKAALNIAKIAGKGISNGFKNLKSGLGKIKSALSDIGKNANKGVHKGFMKILRYGFGIRSMYVLFRRLKEAVKDSFGELQKSGAMFQTTKANVDSLKTALSTLKYQFGAAFEPVFNLVAPALTSFINQLIEIMNVISAFIARLTGRSTYSKVAQVMTNVGSSAGGAAKGVKELNHQLQGFDELNNLTLDPGSSGGGGSGGGGTGAGAMYTEAAVDSVLGDFAKELADNIRAGKWFEVGRAISDKLSETLESIPWDKIYEKARNFGTGLADFLNGLITPRLFGDLGKTIAGAINTVFEAGGAFAKEFDWKNLGTSLGTGITEFFKTANFGQWGETVHDWVTGILDAGIALIESTDFDEIVTKLEDFFNGLKVSDIADKLWEFAKTLGKAIAQAISKLWDDATTKEKIGSAIIGLIAVARLTGIDTALAKAIGGALLGKTISLAGAGGFSVLSLSLVGIAVALIGGEIIGHNVGKLIANIINDPELEEYYDEYKWWKWFPELKRALEEGDFWDGLKLMLEDIPVPDWAKNYLENSKYGKLSQGYTANAGLTGVSNVANGVYELTQNKPTKKSVTIDTKMTGAVKSINQMLQLGTNWNDFSDNYKDKDSKLGTSMLGAFQEVGDIKTASDNFRNLDRDYRSKNVTYTTTMGGEIKNKDEIDVARSKYENLYKAWESKSATLSTNTGGQFKNIGDADTWRDKFTNLLNKWTSKSSTLSATTGGQFKTINDADTWGGKIQNLLNKWVGKSLTMTANFNQPLSTIQGYADQVSKLASSWTSRSATFNLDTNIRVDNLNRVADELAQRINKGLKNMDKRLYFSAKGGIYSGGSWHSIPQYASGTLNAGSMFVAGEAGPEIVGSINGRTEVLNRSQIASTIQAATVKGMMQFRNAKMTQPSDITQGYSAYTSYAAQTQRDMATNTQAILEQNKLLQEQNDLLRDIANKDFSISSREVFNATRSEADNYYKRTGNSAFLY